MGIGPDEAMRFHAFGGVLLDDPGGLVAAVVPVRCRTNAVAFVFYRRHRRRGRLAQSLRADAAGGPRRPSLSPPSGRFQAGLSFENMDAAARWHPYRDHTSIIAPLP